MVVWLKWLDKFNTSFTLQYVISFDDTYRDRIAVYSLATI